MRRDPRKRYSTTEHFQWDDPSVAPFRGLMPRAVGRPGAYLEYELKPGDRLDSLSEEFYGDPRLWWMIVEANPDIFFPVDLVYADDPDVRTQVAKIAAGRRILIPARQDTP